MISPCRRFHRRDAELAEKTIWKIFPNEDSEYLTAEALWAPSRKIYFRAKHVLSKVEGRKGRQRKNNSELGVLCELREIRNLLRTPWPQCLCGES